MEEKEFQENMRRPPPQTVTAARREHQSSSYSNDYTAQQGHVRDGGGQKRYGGYPRDTESRDTGCRQDYKGANNKESYSQDGVSRGDRNLRRGSQGSGSYRGGGGNRGRTSGYGNNSYGGGEGGNNAYRNDGGYSGGHKGGRGSSIDGYRGDGNNSSNYRVDSNSSNFKYVEGNTSNYWGDGGNYSDYRSDGYGYRDGNSGGYSDSKYDQYNSRQGNQSSYDQNQGGRSRGGADIRGGRGGNWSASRGVGIRASSVYTTKEMEMIREFQRSMTMSGHYQQEYDSKVSFSCYLFLKGIYLHVQRSRFCRIL